MTDLSSSELERLEIAAKSGETSWDPAVVLHLIGMAREGERLRKAEDGALLVQHWGAFCDADPTPDGWQERMEAAGFIWLDKTRSGDLQQPFAAERGIYKGGTIWRLTDAGREILAASRGEKTP